MSTATYRRQNFSIVGAVGVPITATSPSPAATALPAGGDDVMVVNASANVVFVKAGASDIGAVDNTGVPVLPNSYRVFSRRGATHIRAYAGSPSQIYVIPGTGA